MMYDHFTRITVPNFIMGARVLMSPLLTQCSLVSRIIPTSRTKFTTAYKFRAEKTTESTDSSVFK
jgi:hypothetical protein